MHNEYIILTEEDGYLELKFKKQDFGKGFSDFMKKFPGYATTAVKIGAEALGQYKAAQRVTARFFARTSVEKQLYSDLADTLVKTGKYKQVTKKVMSDGGLYYEMVKIK